LSRICVRLRYGAEVSLEGSSFPERVVFEEGSTPRESGPAN
jgi:hypothetical protein